MERASMIRIALCLVVLLTPTVPAMGSNMTATSAAWDLSLAPLAAQDLADGEGWLLWSRKTSGEWVETGALRQIEKRELPPVSEVVARYAPDYARTTERTILIGETSEQSSSRYYVGILLELAELSSGELHQQRNPYVVVYSGEDLVVALEVADELESIFASGNLEEAATLAPKTLDHCEDNCVSQNRICLIDATANYGICAGQAQTVAQIALCGLRLDLAITRCALQFNWCWTLCQPI